MVRAANLIVELAKKYYFEGDSTVLPRSIATKSAFMNAMSLDIAMGGSTNTVLHLLAIAREAEVDFTMKDIDELSRKIPNICGSSSPELTLSYGGCQPCRRYYGHYGGTVTKQPD